jgi:hypothetical protein
VPILTRPAGAEAELISALYDEHASVKNMLLEKLLRAQHHGPQGKSEPQTDG